MNGGYHEVSGNRSDFGGARRGLGFSAGWRRRCRRRNGRGFRVDVGRRRGDIGRVNRFLRWGIRERQCRQRVGLLFRLWNPEQWSRPDLFRLRDARQRNWSRNIRGYGRLRVVIDGDRLKRRSGRLVRRPIEYPNTKRAASRRSKLPINPRFRPGVYDSSDFTSSAKVCELRVARGLLHIRPCPAGRSEVRTKRVPQSAIGAIQTAFYRSQFAAGDSLSVSAVPPLARPIWRPDVETRTSRA